MAANKFGLDYIFKVSGLSSVRTALTKAANGVQGVAKQMTNLTKTSGKAVAAVGRVGRSVASTVTRIGALGGVIAGAFSIASITAFGRKAVSLFQDQERAVVQVEQALRSMGNQVGFNSQQLQQFASELQNNSIFGDENILQNVTATLLTFGNVQGSVFKDAQQSIIDMASLLGTDLQGAAIQVGKALNDPVKGVSALQRVGVSFSETQKEQIKQLVETNQLSKAQGIILSELNKQFGGQAKAVAQTDFGRQQQAINAYGDSLERVGGIIRRVFTGGSAIFINEVTNAINGLVDFLESGGNLDKAKARFDAFSQSIIRGGKSFALFFATIAGGRSAFNALNQSLGGDSLNQASSLALTIRTIFISLITVIRNLANAAVNFTRNFTSGFGSSRKQVLTFADVVDIVASRFIRLSEIILSLSNNPAIGLIGSVAGKAFNLLGDAVRRAVFFLTQVSITLKSGGQSFDPFVNLAVNILRLFNQIRIAVVNVFSGISSGVSSNSSGISKFVGLLANLLGQLGKIIETFNGRSAGLGDNFIAPGTSQRAAQIVGFLSKAFELARAFVPVIFAAFAGLQALVIKLAPIVADAFGQIRGILVEAFGAVDFKAIFADIARLLSGADASTAQSQTLAIFFQIRDAIAGIIEAFIPFIPLLITAGGAFLAGFIQAVAFLNNTVRPILDNIAKILGFESFAQAFILFKLAAAVFGGIVFTVSKIAAVFTTLSTLFVNAIGIIKSIGTALVFVKNTFILISAVIGVGAGTLLLIIGSVVAIGAAIFLIVKYWDEIVESVSTVFDFLGNLASSILTGILDAVSRIPDLFIAAFNGVISFILNWSLPGILLRILEAVFPGITQGLIDAFFNGVENIKNIFRDLWDSFKSIFLQPFESAWNGISSFFSGDAPSNGGGGNLPAFASGGSVRGKGTGKSDSILAWLSNGEYVINAAAARAFRPLLDLINYGSANAKAKLMTKGRLPAFANGGPVNMPAIRMPVMNGGIDWSRMSQVSATIDGQPMPGPLFSPSSPDDLMDGFRRINRGRVRRGNGVR